MSADWRQLSRGAGFRVEGDTVVVPLGGGRTQRVEVDPLREDGGLWLASRIAPPRVVRSIPNILERIGRQNRLSELVAYRLDSRGRLVGECWVPTAGLTADEWAFYVRSLASACDRLELVLTGQDEG